MAAAVALPAWADELKRRYLRGESSVFVLFGNVHDKLLVDGQLLGVSDFLAHSVLDKKSVIARYNVSAGCKFVKKPQRSDGLDELVSSRAPDKVLPGLEKLLYAQDNVGVIIDYAETIAPAGDASFSSE